MKCGPVDMQPFVVSPNSWMWNPWRPSARPEMSPTIFVGPSPDCVNVTVPSTPAVPVRTQTAFFSSAARTTREAARPGDARGVNAFAESYALSDRVEVGARVSRRSIDIDRKGLSIF